MDGSGDKTTHNRWLLLVCIAIALQCIASFVFNVRVSHFIADDINAIELAHQTDFLTFVSTPVDIHRVPLHRAVNYVLHHALPMNYAAATAIMLACHALSLLVLYLLLQRLHPAPRLNATLILLYALNHAVLEPLHWWSAGLHRFPLILFTVLSCYCFVRLHQQQKSIFAGGALLSAAVAAGFFIKAILIPAYWMALLFCLMDFRRWRDYRREYLLIAAGLVCAMLYTVWYMQANPHDTIESKTTLNVITTGLYWGLSIAAKLPLQLGSDPLIVAWLNVAWLTLIAAVLLIARDSWRAVAMGFIAVVVNLLMIIASSRATLYGPLIMLMPHYYYELLFLLVIFVSLASKPLSTRFWGARLAQRTVQPVQHRWVTAAALLVAVAAYAAAGWHTTLASIKPGPQEAHWLSARYIRNLRSAMENTDIAALNLIDAPAPKHFRAGTLFPKLLPLSTFLTWFDWHPQFQQQDMALSFIDELGRIQPVSAKSVPVPLLNTAIRTGDQTCSALHPGSASPDFTSAQPMAIERGYLTIYYATSNTASITLELMAGDAKLLGAQIDLDANQNHSIVDLGRFAQFDPIVLTGIRVINASIDLCIQSITVTRY